MAEGTAPPGLDERSVFRSLFSAYPDALVVVDAWGTIVLANPAASSLLGYSVDELTGLSVDALVPDSIRPRHAAYRDAYSHNPRPRPMGTQMELVAKRRDGTKVMVEIALSPLQDEGLPYVVAAVRDIGAYPRVKQALQRARYSEFVAQMGRLAVDTRDIEVLLKQVPEVVAEALQVESSVLFLLEGNQLEFRVAGGIGFMPHEAPGSRIPNRPDTPPGFVLARGEPVIVEDFGEERRFQVPPSYIEHGLVSTLAVPLSDRGRTVGMLAARSRQARRFGDDEVRFLESLANLLAASLQRARSEEELGHAQRLESVGQLTGGIAHDFNNLLTVIQGNLQVLEEHPAVAADEYAQQLVSAAGRASRRGAELTSKLLAFSRRQVLSPSSIDANALVQSLAGMLRRTLDQRILIDVETDPSCPSCTADAGQLESALLNIAINARDAMPSGGRLMFQVQCCEGLPPHLLAEPEADTPADLAYVSITIADTGGGMSDAVKERAFEPFFTTKEAGRGTGLGLSTVYGFVKQSKGAIALESSPGAGTTVTLYIPAVTDQQEGAAEAGDDGAGTLPGLRVLVVEDDPEVREVVRNFLVSLGCTVALCADAEEGLRKLLHDQAFDLLLSDVALGAGMRGPELARKAQELLPGLAILLMSGYSSELLGQATDSPLPWELLPKPYSREQLARATRRAMQAARAQQE